MQNKLILTFLLLSLLVSFVSARDPYQNIITILEKAEALKYAENYEEAEKLYDEVIKMDPDNIKAQKGKDDCRIMIEPIIPMQHLMPTMIDPEYLELIKKSEEAKTPWDKKRAEISLEHYAVRYTGKVFGEQSKEWDKKADKIVAAGINKAKNSADPETTYLETEKELRSLQESAHRSWKGHGPDILDAAIAKLDKYYDENDLFTPSKPLTLSFITSPEVTKEGQVVGLTISLANKSSIPIILISFQLEGLNYETFSWQKALYGSLSYDKKKDEYLYNIIAQQETPQIFNMGLLLPGGKTTFTKKARIPKLKNKAIISFVFLDDETLKRVYFFNKGKGINHIYKPITGAKLKNLSESQALQPAIYKETIFDYQERAPREQVFVLGSDEK
ncbi:MAG: hypothetical protein ABIH22_04450 [Candidatus Margulisiibacteriota bacterium]